METVYIALLTLVGTIIGTITGFGTSTIMIPVVVTFLPPVEAIFLVAIIHYSGDIWKLALFRQGLSLKLVALIGVVGLLPSYIGASMSVGMDKEVLLRLLGVFLVAYFIFLVLRSRFKIGTGNAVALLGGVFAGVSSGLFGIGGPIRSAVVSAFDLPKAVYIATGAAIGLMVDAARIIRYFVGGTPLPNYLWWSLFLFIAVSFLGAQIGKNIVDRIPQENFRKVVAAFLFAMGLKLILFP